MYPFILKKQPPDTESLERLKRWPDLKKFFVGKNVHIFSWEHAAYWRPNSAGYTVDINQAGVYTFEDAYEQTKHCGAEKQITFKLTNKET